MPTRRQFLAAASAFPWPGFARADDALPLTGVADKRLAALDDTLSKFVTENQIPGAALAVSRAGKLAYARGFGYASLATKALVQPNSLFRIASVSKPLTAIAILQLAERKKLRLDDAVVDHVEFEPLPDSKPDPRWKTITIRHCLQHTGGWDRDKSFDPIGRPWEIAKAFDILPPVAPEFVIRYMRGRPLDFDPGTKYGYSNLGYLLLGRIIEKMSGAKYEDFVRREVFAPLKVIAPQLGRALPEKRPKTEVAYHDSKKREGRCLYPPRRGEMVPQPDGVENVEAYEAHGGWIASAVDLARLCCAFDDPSKSSLLSEASIATMWERPDGAPGQGKTVYYGCGWSVRPGAEGRVNAWHSGLIAGTSTLMVRQPNGVNWVVLFNTDSTATGKTAAAEVESRIYKALGAIRDWPTDDQFETYLKL